MKRWIDIAIRVIAAVSVIVWPALFFRVPTQPTTDSAVSQSAISPAVLGASTNPTDREKREVSDLASRFVERLGTYTNQSQPSDVDVLKINATEEMQGAFEHFFTMRDVTVQRSGASFMAVTTTSLATTIVKRNVDQYQVLVTAKVTTVTDRAPVPETLYKAVTVDIQKVGAQWKVHHLDLTP